MAVGQNQWYHLLGVGAPPILVYFSGDWDVHWGYGILTHGHMFDLGKIVDQNLILGWTAYPEKKQYRATVGIARPLFGSL